MTSWDFASQLLLVALFSWSVHTSPTQTDWRKSLSENAKVTPGLQNVASEGISPSSSKSAGASVSWVLAKPQSKLSFQQPSKQVQPAVASSPKQVPLPALTPEGSTLWSIQAPKTLSPSAPVVSWPVDSLTQPSSRSAKEPLEFLSLPQNTEEPSSLLVDPLETFLLPPSNPEGPAVPWLVDPSESLPFPSNPEMPAISWKVGLPKKFPPPPPVQEWSAGNWLAESLSTPTLPKNQGSGIPLPSSSPETELNSPPTSEGPVRWVAQPSERKLLQSPQGAAASLGLNTKELVDPFRSAVDQLGEMPLEGLASYLPFAPEPNLPLSETEHYPLKEGPAQEMSVGETELLETEPPYQGGELSLYASLYEHGNSQHETEDYSLAPSYGIGPPLPYLNRAVPNLFYLFVTGQLPHGTVSHTETNYEAGRGHTTKVGFEKDSFPTAEGPGIHSKKVSS